MDGRKNNGGKRNGAGRKKLPKKHRRIGVTVFLKNETLSANGGTKAVKQLIINTLEPA